MKQRLFKRATLIVLLSLSGIFASAQNWTWVKGNNIQDQPGTYGTINVPAAANNPGARENAMRWKDAAGNFWLFGGYGYDGTSTAGLLNDLWKYDISLNQWTWIKGSTIADQPGTYGTLMVGAAANVPGGRGDGATWADASGNLWLFGGSGYDASATSGLLNDLWKYNIATNQWTWMSGNNLVDFNGVYGTLSVPASTVFPGSRIGPSFFKDASNNLWLFGGFGFDNSNTSGSFLNDLWKFNTTTNQWTWMGGSNINDQPGTYGTLGTPATSNIPGARFDARGETDASGNFWLFGGFGFDNTSFSVGENNDLWRFNPTTMQWTWMKGSNVVDQNGVYGTLNVPAASNVPGSRHGFAMWADASGYLFIFGGNALDASNSSADYMNDLWRYSIASNQWTWIKGSNTQLQGATYGVQGTPAPANTPGARYTQVSWVDNANNLWLFGGNGFDGSSYGEQDDLWKFSNCVPSTLTITTSPSITCPGKSTTITVSGAATYTWSTSQQTTAIVVNTSSNTTYTVNGTNVSGCQSSAIVTHSVYSVAAVTISASSNTVCAGSTATLTAAGANTYTWSNNVSAASITVSPTGATVYTLTSADANTCSNTASYTVSAVPLPSVNITTSKATICAGESATLTSSAASSYSWHTPASVTNSFLVVKPSADQQYSVTVTGSNGCKNMASITQSVAPCLGIQDVSPATISIYPNPSNGFITIKAEGLGSDSYLLLVNNLGQEVLRKKLEGDTISVDTTLAKGLYHCRIISAGNVSAYSKVIVE
jgi:N-acetylneuraminic acid mutarotase